jgi:hypothetical protein
MSALNQFFATLAGNVSSQDDSPRNRKAIEAALDQLGL